MKTLHFTTLTLAICFTSQLVATTLTIEQKRCLAALRHEQESDILMLLQEETNSRFQLINKQRREWFELNNDSIDIFEQAANIHSEETKNMVVESVARAMELQKKQMLEWEEWQSEYAQNRQILQKIHVEALINFEDDHSLDIS